MRQRGTAIGLSFAALIALSPLTVSTAAAQDGDCVRTVRSISDFTIRGDAWTWWDHAAGQYDREHRPAVGSVLVFKRTGHMRRGHVSLVSAVIDRRTIEVDHSWLDGDGLRRGMRVVDVSRNNDWSSVRVWHEPTDQLGLRVYAAYGFIMPEGEEAPRSGRMLDAGDRGMDQGFASSPRGRSKATGPRMLEASLQPQKNLSVSVPGRKPQSLPTTAVASHTPQKPQRMDVAVLPSRKPASAHAAPVTVAELSSPGSRRTVAPGRKPGSGNSVAQLAETNGR
ncbi:CHAP domain-containing protein [Azospirillum sp. A1-3]|uniref:CHAP domain-containing protein n=1 Tax=Azospirillum sp. A1-3 TaxID=185874 RepID=UPI0020774A9B|nr:CHAP domain-containing protein [Azospirillum sp. A1-3]MCM8733105.1 CHAP domain-containing protein [Azospirillum sp. A1-3]